MECGVRGVLDSKYYLGEIGEQGLNLGTGRGLGTGLVINAISQHDFLLIYFVYLVHPIYFHIHNIFSPYGFHSTLWDLWTKGRRKDDPLNSEGDTFPNLGRSFRQIVLP